MLSLSWRVPLSATLAFVLLCRPVVGLRSSLGPVVNLGYAAYAGNSTSPTGEVNSSVTFFGGIPFAQPPLGDLRFRAPQQLDETVKTDPVIIDARNWGPPCIQQPAMVGAGSEDCLLINVWKPTNATEGDNLPVIVYIYGGGAYYGTPQGFPLYDWVAQHRSPGVVAVSMGYRLNLFGFLAAPVAGTSIDANAGLLDQRAALEWVQRHISKFGGNPKNVTIDGESAGGASVLMQTVAYGGTKPVPFNRAIAQSIGYGNIANSTQIANNFASVISTVGCTNSTSIAHAISCLRGSSVGALVAAVNHLKNGQPNVIIDGEFLPELPSYLVTSGNFSKLDSFVGGHCTNDGRTFVGGSPSQFVTDQDVETLVFKRWPGVTQATINEAMKLYPAPGTPGSPFSTQYERAWTMAQEIVFGCMDWYFANKMAEKGVEQVYGYRWNAPDPVLLASQPYLGVMHTSDLYFLMDGTNTAANAGATFTSFNTTEAALSREAIAYWTSFAASGNPSSSKLSTSPLWTTFLASASRSNSTQYRMVLTEANSSSPDATASTMEQVPADEAQRCAFWMREDITPQTGI